MAPTIEPDAYLLLLAYRSRRPQRGDICVFDTSIGEPVVKRLAQKWDDERFRVCGDSPLSVPGIDLGPVEANALIGRAIFVLQPGALARIVKSIRLFIKLRY